MQEVKAIFLGFPASNLDSVHLRGQTGHDKQEQVEHLLLHGSEPATSENAWACCLTLAASSIAGRLERLVRGHRYYLGMVAYFLS